MNGGTSLLETVNAILRFGLELCALVALGYWGFRAAGGPLQWLLGLGAPAGFALVWGAYVAPKAPYRLEDPGRLFLEACVFTMAVLALAAAGSPLLAGVLAAAVVVNLGLMLLLDQRGTSGI